MLERKDAARAYTSSGGRTREAWSKALSETWAGIGMERMKTRVWSPSSSPREGEEEKEKEQGQAQPIELLDPMIDFGRHGKDSDRLEAYLARSGGITAKTSAD